MSINTDNDLQEAGVIESQKKISPERSEFFEVIAQNADQTEKSLNYQGTTTQTTEKLYSLEEVRDLSSPELSQLLMSNDSSLTAEEIMEKEFNKDEINGREQSILVESMRFGNQSAFYQRSMEYQDFFQTIKHELSRIFVFNQLMLANGRVIPPIIAETEDLKSNEGLYVKRFVKKSYKIKEQARTTNNYLDWRSYLMVAIPKPIMPSSYYLPIKGNEREESIWANGSSQGWESGIIQADQMIMQKMKKLESDFFGMVRYHILLKKKMISSPIYTNIRLGVTKDNETLNIGEVVFEVIENPKFLQDAEKWLALPQIKSPLDLEKFKK